MKWQQAMTSLQLGPQLEHRKDFGKCELVCEDICITRVCIIYLKYAYFMQCFKKNVPGHFAGGFRQMWRLFTCRICKKKCARVSICECGYVAAERKSKISNLSRPRHSLFKFCTLFPLEADSSVVRKTTRISSVID